MPPPSTGHSPPLKDPSLPPPPLRSIGAYVTSKISSSYPGVCPRVKCPGFKCEALVPQTSWQTFVGPDLERKYTERAASLLSIQCGSCHTRKSMMIPLNAANTAAAAKWMAHPEGSGLTPEQLESVEEQKSLFVCGDISDRDFFRALEKICPDSIVEGTREGPCKFMLNLLHTITDAGRRAELHVIYLRKYPKCHPPCCASKSSEHCFNCHVKVWHTGVTCSEYQAAKNTVDDVLPCPKCGLQLVKGDGTRREGPQRSLRRTPTPNDFAKPPRSYPLPRKPLTQSACPPSHPPSFLPSLPPSPLRVPNPGCSSVNCVCGTNFNWVTELGKYKNRIRSERSRLFRRRHPHWPAEAAVVLSHAPPGTEDQLLAAAYTSVESAAVQAATGRATVAKARAWTAQHGDRAVAAALDCLGDGGAAQVLSLSTKMPSEQADRLASWLAAGDGANKLALEAEVEARQRRFADTWVMLQVRQPVCAATLLGAGNSSCPGWSAAVALAWPCLLPSPSSSQFVNAWAVVNAGELQQTQAQLWVLLHAHNVPRAAAAANVVLGTSMHADGREADEEVVYYTAKHGWERKKLHVRVPSQVKRVSKGRARVGPPMPPPSRQALSVLSKAWSALNPDAAHLAKMHRAWFAEHEGLGAVARATSSGTWIKSKQQQQQQQQQAAAEDPDALIPPPPASEPEMKAWYEKTFKTHAYNICMRSRAAAGLETAPALPNDWRATAPGPRPSPSHVAQAPPSDSRRPRSPSPRATTNATPSASGPSLLEQIRGGNTTRNVSGTSLLEQIRGGNSGVWRRRSPQVRPHTSNTTGPSRESFLDSISRSRDTAVGRRRRDQQPNGSGGGGGGGSGGGSRGGGRVAMLEQLIRVERQQQEQQEQQQQQFEQVLVEAEQPDWSCSACTFLNPMSGNRCEMCNTARPLEASSTPVPSPNLTPGPGQAAPSLPRPPNGAGGGHPHLHAIQTGFALRNTAAHQRSRANQPTPTSTLTLPPGGLPAPLSLSGAADEDDLLDQPEPLSSVDIPYSQHRGNAALLQALQQRRQRIADDDAPPTPPPTAPMLHRHPLMFGGLSRSRTPETNPSDDLFDSDSDSEDW